jgi:hypothetical protein
VAEMKRILRDTISEYACEGLNGYTYMTSNDEQTKHTIVAVVHDDNIPPVFTNLIAHLEGDMIVIYHDANNKPLVDALVQNGIPRDKIILAYAGETIAPSN